MQHRVDVRAEQQFRQPLRTGAQTKEVSGRVDADLETAFFIRLLT
jgi:hypothetical protein